MLPLPSNFQEENVFRSFSPSRILSRREMVRSSSPVSRWEETSMFRLTAPVFSLTPRDVEVPPDMIWLLPFPVFKPVKRVTKISTRRTTRLSMLPPDVLRWRLTRLTPQNQKLEEFSLPHNWEIPIWVP